MDALDRALIEATQAGLPLTERPFAAVAAIVGSTEADVLARFARLQAEGVLRRIAAVPNHYALGYRANGMSVWDVPDEHVDALGARVGALPFVSHCYRRPRRLPLWPYNLFAMVHGRSREDTDAQVRVIAQLLGPHCRGHDVLYSTRVLKKTGLRLGSAAHATAAPTAGTAGLPCHDAAQPACPGGARVQAPTHGGAAISVAARLEGESSC